MRHAGFAGRMRETFYCSHITGVQAFDLYLRVAGGAFANVRSQTSGR